MDGIVYTLYIFFIVINFKKKNISLHDLLVCQYTFSTCKQPFFQSQNSVYIFPHIFPSRGLYPWPTSCPSWKYYCTRHVIFNYFDSCSIGILMFLYIVLKFAFDCHLIAPLHKSYVLSWVYLVNPYSDIMDSIWRSDSKKSEMCFLPQVREKSIWQNDSSSN